MPDTQPLERLRGAATMLRDGSPITMLARDGDPIDGADLMQPHDDTDLVVVANRLPYDSTVAEDGIREWRASPGGLVTALLPVLAQRKGTWVGWGGSPGAESETFDLDGVTLRSVPLNHEDVTLYYEGLSNATIWPLYHDAVEPPVFDRTWLKAYRDVNERFARAAAEAASPGATVWVHDYQLQLVPAQLRAMRPDLRIGFFLHIPFPPIELFMKMPFRTELLKGLLGADLIGFQAKLAAQNFVRLARHVLGVRYTGSTIHLDGRDATALAFPVSIDVGEIEELVSRPDVQEDAQRIKHELGNPATLILGVDRLDYTKGIEVRLEALGELLADRQVSVPETVMVQIATPSRERIESYEALRTRVEREVGRINGEYGQVGIPAVHYLRQSFTRRELAPFFLAADVMLVTPLRDGMNLVAKEYVAARGDGGGALVLSEFAGAASELRQAYLCNPYDVDGVKSALLAALRADPRESRRRLRLMQRHLRQHTVDDWATNFLAALHRTAKTDSTRHAPSPFRHAETRTPQGVGLSD